MGSLLASGYKRIDVGGWLSDVIADPQIIYEFLIPKAREKRQLMQTSPEISVVMAARNNADTLEAAIRSILDQRHVSVELIVVDDGSDDHSVELIEGIAAIDNRVRLLCNNKQRGTGFSRNKGMLAARGEYLTFQDGDDVSYPTRLSKQLAALKRYPAKKIVTCNYVRVNESGERLLINDRRTMKCIISMMFPRREVLEKVGFFREDSVSEDADYYERIKIAFGKGCDVMLFRTLYNALFRPSSSFFQSAQITSYDGTTVIFERRKDALEYWEALRQQHQEMSKGERSPFVPISEASAPHMQDLFKGSC